MSPDYFLSSAVEVSSLCFWRCAAVAGLSSGSAKVDLSGAVGAVVLGPAVAVVPAGGDDPSPPPAVLALLESLVLLSKGWADAGDF